MNTVQLGVRVRILRAQRLMTQLDLGEKSGLHHQTISHMERGKKMVSRRVIEQVARALKVDVETLLDPNESALDRFAQRRDIVGYRGRMRYDAGIATRLALLAEKIRRMDEQLVSMGTIVAELTDALREQAEERRAG
jgi:transcriptional regulator with XRE-family HTH domain